MQNPLAKRDKREKFMQASISATRKRDLLIRQANVITSAKTDLTRDQRRIVHHLLVQIAKTHKWPEGGTLEIDYKEFSKIYQIGPQEARDDLRRAINDFRGKVVTYSQKYDVLDSWALGETSEVELNWTTKREKISHAGKYRITFNPELRELLMPLIANDNGAKISFTILEYSETVNLLHKYSILLYESCCQFRFTGIFRVQLEKLIDRWCIPSSYQKNYSDLRKKLLDKAIEEIRTKTGFKDLQLFEKRGDRNKVVTLEFRFTPSEI